MDTQIWYAIFSTLFGGISGAFNHLGEVTCSSSLLLVLCKHVTDSLGSISIFFVCRYVHLECCGQGLDLFHLLSVVNLHHYLQAIQRESTWYLIHINLIVKKSYANHYHIMGDKWNIWVMQDEAVDERDIARFSQMWNKFVYTMRDEDLISDEFVDFFYNIDSSH